ncbi:hypothetical protein GBAR_LOCUS11498 [Geodia barretti]|uniref:Uncharacterized protein n=1 Tax=Geodia barretti TaxID=519541 RepID=A0AA35RZ22_GEOBA|nr:hypothetical protein GBAR_LOCUS11498 [Geodia barretti]
MGVVHESINLGKGGDPFSQYRYRGLGTCDTGVRRRFQGNGWTRIYQLQGRYIQSTRYLTFVNQYGKLEKCCLLCAVSLPPETSADNSQT